MEYLPDWSEWSTCVDLLPGIIEKAEENYGFRNKKILLLLCNFVSVYVIVRHSFNL